ncbi:tripartite tricarboxylate transporter substrate-binding protein [uncultured Thalassospira sp.]|uniref:Bug family tripartite tricarboxylate transporter substrate binding protein n=1 Tax=uncultured Thalassospira sp. TaxID=404382 RepID=UPI0030DAD2EA
MTRSLFKALTIAASMVIVSTAAQAFEPEQPECIAPANAGGGWDFTCRQIGKTLYDLKTIASPMQVVNMAGGSGGVAYAEVVSKRNDDNDLIVAASSATTTRLAQGAFPGSTMDQVRWVGTIGADYGVIAVSKNSAIKTLPELFEKVKTDPKSLAFAGGSAVGGWDHLKVLLAAKAAGISDIRKIKYVAFEGGGEAVTQLLGGHVQVFTGDISEAKGFVDSGDLRVLAVLADERLPGEEFNKFPTAKEQGIDAVGANWRGFYAPKGMSDEAYDYWVNAIKTTYASDEWKEVMANNGMMPLAKFGPDFEKFVKHEISSTQTLSREIGLIK